MFYREQLFQEIENGLSFETFSPKSRNSFEMQINHDKKIFEESDSIFSEDDMNNLFYQLSQHFYRLELGNKIDDYCRFFYKSSNSFINNEISDSVKVLIKSVDEPIEFTSHKFFVEDGYTENPIFRLQPDINYTENAIYLELSKQLDKLCLQVRGSYQNYRLAIKKSLFI